jgi:hypothetical protein
MGLACAQFSRQLFEGSGGQRYSIELVLRLSQAVCKCLLCCFPIPLQSRHFPQNARDRDAIVKKTAQIANAFNVGNKLESVATCLGTTPMAVALAWLLQHSPNILLIPGTSSVSHLRDNVSAAALILSEEDLDELNGIAS